MKIITAFFISCTLLGGTVEASAQPKIDQVKFVGVNAISAADLLEDFKPLNFLATDTSRIKAGISSVQEKYFSEGYLLFRVDSFTVSGENISATLTIYISEGHKLLVGKILIGGNKFFTYNQLASDMNIRVGKSLNQIALRSDLEYILDKYNSNGYPLAEMKIDSIFKYQNGDIDSLGISLSIDEGQRFRINAIRIEGNSLTKDYVIIRAMRIPIGTYYNDQEMANAKERLQKLGFFQSVSEPEIYESGDTTGLLVKVTEGNTNTFDGVIGYMPAQLGQSGYFTGMIDISMVNLFGTGRKFRAMWHQETKLTQELEIGYAEPYILGYPVNGEVDFSQRQQDTTSVTRNFAISGVSSSAMSSTGRSRSALFPRLPF